MSEFFYEKLKLSETFNTLGNTMEKIYWIQYPASNNGPKIPILSSGAEFNIIAKKIYDSIPMSFLENHKMCPRNHFKNKHQNMSCVFFYFNYFCGFRLPHTHTKICSSILFIVFLIFIIRNLFFQEFSKACARTRAIQNEESEES